MRHSTMAEQVSEIFNTHDVQACIEAIENDAKFDWEHTNCNALTIETEPFDLASEIEPSVFDRFLANDGTPAIERRLRKQGLRKAEDDTRGDIQEIWVEVGDIVTKRTVRMHLLRQISGDAPYCK